MATYVNCKLKLDSADHKALLRVANMFQLAANEDPLAAEPAKAYRALARAVLEFKERFEVAEAVTSPPAKEAKPDAS